MSHSSTLNLERVPPLSNRRKHPRRKPDQLIYVGIGTDNGGFVIDISEAGLSFQGIMPLSGGGQTVQVAFKLPGTNIPIRAEGQLVRPGNSEKGGGLRLLNLPAEAQLQLREWVERQGHAEAPASVDPDALPEPSEPTAGTNDWISSLTAKQERTSRGSFARGFRRGDAVYLCFGSSSGSKQGDRIGSGEEGGRWRGYFEENGAGRRRGEASGREAGTACGGGSAD